MRSLHHFPLCPFSRKVRLCLAEKHLDFGLELVEFWNKNGSFYEINHAEQVPVMVDLNGATIADSSVICEYLDETYPEKTLLAGTPAERAEVRRLVVWFDQIFGGEVTLPLLYEKVIKRQMKLKEGPNSTVIRTSKCKLKKNLEYLGWLVDRRKWLAGNHLSFADLAAGAHLSVIDYLGDIEWDLYPVAKDWYARIKSRQSFRSLLQDRAPGVAPPSHYAVLDF